MSILHRRRGDTHIFCDNEYGIWVHASGPAFPEGPPLEPYEGAIFFRTDLKAPFIYHNNAWVLQFAEALPVDAVFYTVSSLDPHTLLGYGQWTEIVHPGPPKVHAWKRTS